ncbi:hypothetical protein ACQRBF_08080 [Peptoniphilaceae bacterium SGI.131]
MDDSAKVVSILFKTQNFTYRTLRNIINYLKDSRNFEKFEKKGLMDYDKFIKSSEKFYKVDLFEIDKRLLSSVMKKYNLSYTIHKNNDNTYRFLCKSRSGIVDLEKIDLALNDYEEARTKLNRIDKLMIFAKEKILRSEKVLKKER